MTDLIVFSVGNNRYAINIENIQRIIQASELTGIPNANKVVDGMMSYENSVIKVLNFRKLIGLKTYDEELRDLFLKLKAAHKEWIDELGTSVRNGISFTKTTDPHKCELGMWLDNFNSYDDQVSSVLKSLIENHKHLHSHGSNILEITKNDKEKAISILETQVKETYTDTMRDLDDFINEFERVANSLQKLLIYEKDSKSFAIKVDSIDDIAHIEESNIMNADDSSDSNEFLELLGVLEINGVLTNVIKTVNLPK